ncbi:hypothetical protein SUGI_0374780 [Cryptomeria japonica]|nr:hypothetical protein SUGI_0374780 [Cryptomeria japonica]
MEDSLDHQVRAQRIFYYYFRKRRRATKGIGGGSLDNGFETLNIQRWHRNFNPLKTDPYDKPLWIRLNNLSMEYWTEEAPEKVGRSLGTLMDIDVDIAQGNSDLYARLQLVAVRRIPLHVKLCAHGMEWIQSIEIEEETFYYLNCGRQNHSTSKRKVPKKEKKEWRQNKKITQKIVG